MTWTSASPRDGSSPRVRGKQDPRGDLLDVGGLIPARAGKTWAAWSTNSPPPAHPRACGENVHLPLERPPRLGSSPRVRGKRGIFALSLIGSGLIPARAGKTCGRWGTTARARAHPRACGENSVGIPTFPGGYGSSPRVRGKRPRPALCAGAGRLIPARAGKTPRPRRPARSPGAHPRACGENPVLNNFIRGLAGSSPRVRGKLSSAREDLSAARLIPACAGKTA